MAGCYSAAARIGLDPFSAMRRAVSDNSPSSAPMSFFQRLDTGPWLDPALVHIQGAIDLYLQNMDADPRPAIMPGNEPAGIGTVAPHGIVPVSEEALCPLDKGRGGSDTMTVAENDIDRTPLAADMTHGAGRHGVPVDQEAEAELFERFGDQPLQGPVIGRVVGADAVRGIIKGELLAVDRFGIGDDAGNGAEPGRDPDAVRGGAIGQRVGEHVRVQLERLPVHIHINTREKGRQKRRARRIGALQHLLHEAVFRRTQVQWGKPGRRKQIRGVEAAAVRRGNHERAVALRGAMDPVNPGDLVRYRLNRIPGHIAGAEKSRLYQG